METKLGILAGSWCEIKGQGGVMLKTTEFASVGPHWIPVKGATEKPHKIVLTQQVYDSEDYEGVKREVGEYFSQQGVVIFNLDRMSIR